MRGQWTLLWIQCVCVCVCVCMCVCDLGSDARESLSQQAGNQPTCYTHTYTQTHTYTHLTPHTNTPLLTGITLVVMVTDQWTCRAETQVTVWLKTKLHCVLLEFSVYKPHPLTVWHTSCPIRSKYVIWDKMKLQDFINEKINGRKGHQTIDMYEWQRSKQEANKKLNIWIYIYH